MRPGLAILIVLASCNTTGPAAPPATEGAARSAAPAPPDGEFLPVDYQGELFVDWAAIREVGLLDRLERVPMAKEMLDAVTGPLCSAEDLATVRTAFLDGDGDRRAGSITVATLVDGMAPKTPDPNWHWPPVQVGSHAGYRHGESERNPVSVFARSNVVVDGPIELVTKLLNDPTPGRPHADLLPMLAGDGVLAQLAYGRFGRRGDDVLRTFGPVFGDADDPADFVRLRLSRAADGAILFAITLRFAHGSTGLRAAEQTTRERLDSWLADARMKPFRPILANIVLAHHDRDLDATLVLGTPAEAVGTIERVLVAGMALQAAQHR